MYLVIDEKEKRVDLREKGIELIRGNGGDGSLLVLGDISWELCGLENERDLREEEKVGKKDEVMRN